MQLMKCADTMERLRRVGLLIAIGWAAAIVGANSGRAADACASLKDLKIEDATITAAEGVPAGSFTAADSKSLRQSAGLLQGDRHRVARARLGDPPRNVASAGGMEGRVRRNRERRLRRPVQLSHPGGGTAPGLCRHQHRSGNGPRDGAERRRHRRSPGEMARLGVSFDSPHDGRRQADRISLLRQGVRATPISPAARPAVSRRLSKPSSIRRITTALSPARLWSTAPICTPPSSGAARRPSARRAACLGTTS